ncbi:putative reverse transcriptase domain-containing protein, partial [Tanacetum coccineum]
GMGRRAGRGCGKTRGRYGDQGDGRIDGQGGQVAQVGDQGRDQGNGRNQNGDAINDNIRGDVRNIIEKNDRRGYTYKEFLACNHKEYDGKGGAVVYTCFNMVEFSYLHIRLRGCHSTPWSGPAMLRILIATEPSTIQKAVQIAGTLTDEALRNGSVKKNPNKRGNEGEPIKDMNVRDDNKRTRTGNTFAITANPIRGGYMGTAPKVVPRNVNPINARKPISRTCYECGSTDHIKAACPRGQGRGNQGNQARGRAFMLGAEEARQDSNIVTGIEPSDLGFSYEIKIASGQLVKIDKVIKGCKLEIEGYVFDINLIPFGSGSFDMIIGMDWLSNHKAEIICHEKVVRIPLPDDKVLRVIGERPDKKVRHLEIEFRIELVPGAMPVAKSPYRLAPSELEELPGQLKELQDKGFILPSSSPWGTPVLFVKKKGWIL